MTRIPFRLARIVLLGAMGVCVSLQAAESSAPGTGGAPAGGAFTGLQTVRDLYYGDVLFHFFQDDYFGAVTRLDAAQSLGRMTAQGDEPELLKGALYLSLGQHVESGRIFRRLLEGNVGDDVRNRAWFYLAKIWYQRNYLAEAESALNAIRGPLPAPLESERQLLHAQVLMYQQRYDEAIARLQSWSSADDAAAYARFNLGVALVRAGRTEEAARFLDEVGQMPVDNQELAALRDKANLALGFAWLQAERPADARAVLERVRLEGPQSNKALLGAGWAESAAQQYRSALVPWLELQGRDLLDASVQEAHLAIPYAYGQLSANRQAVDSYNRAVEVFQQEDDRLRESIAAIREGRMLNALLETEQADRDGRTPQGWYWQLKTLPDAPETRYLYHLVASNRFQEGLKNFRDLRAMQDNLAMWRDSVAVFQDMIDTRRQAHTERLPQMQATLSGANLVALDARRNDLQQRLERIERDDEVAGLATATEHEQWTRIGQLEAALAGAPAGVETDELRDKVRRLRGVVYWQMNAGYKARLWRERKTLRELDVLIRDARQQQTGVGRAEHDTPERTEGFADRVRDLAPRVDGLGARLAQAQQAQARYLADIAVQELELQRQRLASYGEQAQFALAALYDRAHAAATAPTTVTPSLTPAEGTP